MAYQPVYRITNKILTSVSRSEAAKEIIENSPLVPMWERKFQGQALVRSVHHSTALEGNELSIDDTEIEIKSSYILDKQGGETMLDKKRKAVQESGKNYLLILDKNYKEFLNLINLQNGKL